MGKAHRRRHGDHVAREQRQLHAGLPLRHAVAHGRHPAGHLRRAADLARRLADDLRVALEGLVGREHVVVGGDDAEIGRLVVDEPLLVGGAAGGKAVGEIAAGQRRALRAGRALGGNALQIGLAGGLRALADAGGDGFDATVCGHGSRPFGGWVVAAIRAASYGRPEHVDRLGTVRAKNGTHRHVGDRTRLGGPLVRGELVGPLDVQRQEAGVDQHRQGQRHPRLAGARRCYRHHRLAAVRVDRFAQRIGAGKERGGVAVVSHAEDDDVEGPRHPLEAVVQIVLRRIGRVGVDVERQEAGGRRLVLEKMSAQQRAVGALVRLRHPALVDEGDGDVVPVDVDLRQAFEQKLRRRAARDGERCDAARRDGAAEHCRDTAGERLGERLARIVAVEFGLAHRWRSLICGKSSDPARVSGRRVDLVRLVPGPAVALDQRDR